MRRPLNIPQRFNNVLIRQLHVLQADEANAFGPAPASESYKLLAQGREQRNLANQHHYEFCGKKSVNHDDDHSNTQPGRQ
jgi:hypothetical protein